MLLGHVPKQAGLEAQSILPVAAANQAGPPDSEERISSKISIDSPERAD